MKYIIFLLFIVIILMAIFFVLQKKPEPELLPRQLPILQSTPLVVQNKIIKEINQRIKGIENLSAKIDIEISGLRVDLVAELYFQKAQNLRMRTYSRFGLETDVGGNANYIWFWSKRMKTKDLYFCPREKAGVSRLRPALNPNWLIQILNVSKVSEHSLRQWENKYVILENLDGLKKITVIDPKHKRAIGHYLYENNRMLAGCEITEFYGSLPKELHFYWVEENLHIVWRLSEYRLNQRLSQTIFTMPSMPNRTDISQ